MRYQVNPDYRRPQSVGETFADFERSMREMTKVFRLAGIDLDELARTMRKLNIHTNTEGTGPEER